MTITDRSDPLLSPPTRPPSGDSADARTEQRPRPQPGDRLRRQPPNKTKQQANKWMRWVHVYVSMFALLVILFFGLTGLTLNNPDWTFGDEMQQSTVTGTLPRSVIVDDRVEMLLVSEYFRDQQGVGGELASFDTSPTSGALSYRGPGYSADVLFDVPALDYTLTVQQQGFVAVMGDIHRGSSTGSEWKWVINIAAGALVVVSVTGLGIQFLMRKRRTQALIVAGTGSVVTVLLIWIATA